MVHIVVALECEARPLIAGYGLKLLSRERSYRIYEGEGLRLIISGVGKVAAAGATAHASDRCGDSGDPADAWVNVGVGGHRDQPVGQGFLAHEITDRASGRSWAPPIVFRPPCPTGSVLTVERPEREYASTCIYDMEAAGFYATASRLATAELVQCYKVISDNGQHSVREVSAKGVERLLEASLGDIGSIIDELRGLSVSMSSGDSLRSSSG